MNGEIRVRVNSFGEGRNLSMVYHDPITGKKVARSAGTRDMKEALRKAGVWEAELREGRYHAPSKITWAEFRTRHATERLDALAEKTRNICECALDRLERTIHPDRLEKVTAAVLSRFAAQLRKEGLGEVSIGAYLGHLKAAFRWAESVGMLREAPRVNMPKRAKGKRFAKGRPLVAEEFDRMLAAVPKVRPHDADQWTRYLQGLWRSGLRLQESLALSWDEDSPFTVCLSGKHPTIRIRAEAQKSNRDEVLPMTPDFAQWLLETPEADRTGLVLAPLGLQSGKPLVPERVGSIVSRFGKAAGIVVNRETKWVNEPVTDPKTGKPTGERRRVQREVVKYASCHDLRRSFGTRWARKVAPAVLVKLMRHSSVQTSMAYYVDLDAAGIADQLWSSLGGDPQAATPNEHAPGNGPGNIPQIAPPETGKRAY